MHFFFVYSPIDNLQTGSLYFVAGEFYFISLDRNIHVQIHYTMQRNETKSYEIKAVNFLAKFTSRIFSCLFISLAYALLHYMPSLETRDSYRFLLIYNSSVLETLYYRTKIM